jgi:hypothetical protein
VDKHTKSTDPPRRFKAPSTAFGGPRQPVPPKSPGRPRKTPVERKIDRLLAELMPDIAANFERRLEALLPLAEDRLVEILAPGGARPAEQLKAIELVVSRVRGAPLARNINVNLDNVAVAHVTPDELATAARRLLERVP